ncbi:predicted protein [Uncinocarpus reesii 1704]|uniref:Myb-like domain-containing protein n=1 Tax=Uncinocarpus reesii (strain UAMH 1704) TaxID=336963 RepID=C4JTU4_UNCRE|nr:uncharacterized protein UREG_05883 [Uncinocarpus reesii 1704]EEP81041.1 predicted protein [Uncinocarpus reesii 1704]
MPPSTRSKSEFKISFADVFKSASTLRAEAAAAAFKRSLLEAHNNESASAAQRLLTSKEAAPAPANQKVEANPAASNPEPAPVPAAPSTTNPAKSSIPVFEWTAEQDFQLLKLKAENAPWRAISASIGKPVYVLKDRWGVIQPKTMAPIKKPKAREEPKPAKPEGNNKPSGRRVSFSEPLVTNNDGARDADLSKKVLYLDEAFTLEEVILLNQIAAKYDEDKWIRVSSRFFDKTGKRLPPRILKKHVRVE